MQDKFSLNLDGMKATQIYNLILFSLVNISITVAQNPIQQAISQFVKDPANNNSSISIHVLNLENEKEIASFQPNLAITSASTTKLFSTSAAFEVLGANHRSDTKIYLEGELNKEGILKGNIWIRGGGDVSLGSKYFSPEGKELDFLAQWTDSLKKLGVKFIEGAIIADGSAFGYAGVPDGWDWNDIGNYFGAAARGLNLYDNLVKVNFRTFSVGSKSAIVSIYPEVPGLNYKNSVYAANVSGDNSYLYGAPFSLDRSAEGKLPRNQSSFEVKGSMPDPELQISLELYRACMAADIQVEDGYKSVRTNSLLKHPNYSTMKLLFLHEGKTVEEIAYWTNMKSVNLFAEGLLNQLGYAISGDGSTSNSLAQLTKFLKDKIATEGLILQDGSGLSRSNAISAKHFTSLLNYMWNSKSAESFKKTLPVAGVSGTIKGLCKGQTGEGRIYAKSGTISRVKSYAGYVETVSGKKLAFAITVNNFTCTSSQITDKMEKVLNAIAAY